MNSSPPTNRPSNFQKINSNESISYQKRAICFSKLNKPDLAVADFEKVLNLDPNNVDIELSLCEQLLRLKKYNECLEHLDQGEIIWSFYSILIYCKNVRHKNENLLNAAVELCDNNYTTCDTKRQIISTLHLCRRKINKKLEELREETRQLESSVSVNINCNLWLKKFIEAIIMKFSFGRQLGKRKYNAEVEKWRRLRAELTTYLVLYFDRTWD